MKIWYKSKGVWLGVLGALIPVVDLAMGTFTLTAGQLQTLLFVGGVLAIIVRILTSDSIAFKK
jgi:hypothetical protein